MVELEYEVISAACREVVQQMCSTFACVQWCIVHSDLTVDEIDPS